MVHDWNMSQAVGLCEAAYREAYNYAIDRRQFGKAIIHFLQFINDCKHSCKN